MSGHDSLEYLPRTVEFYTGLQGGQWFPRWAPDLSAGYGQPFFSFNPPLHYYASALFHFLGFSFVSAQNLASAASCWPWRRWACTCFAGTLIAGRRGGLVAATAYLTAPYLLVALFVRHALADFTAFAFLPWALWGVAQFASGRDGRGLRGPVRWQSAACC